MSKQTACHLGGVQSALLAKVGEGVDQGEREEIAPS